MRIFFEHYRFQDDYIIKLINNHGSNYITKHLTKSNCFISYNSIDGFKRFNSSKQKIKKLHLTLLATFGRSNVILCLPNQIIRPLSLSMITLDSLLTHTHKHTHIRCSCVYVTIVVQPLHIFITIFGLYHNPSILTPQSQRVDRPYCQSMRIEKTH